jgi:hypothetical protein
VQCCSFSSAHQRKLRHGGGAGSDVFLCSLRPLRLSDARTFCHNEQRTTSESQHAALSSKCAPACPNVDLGANRTPRGGVRTRPNTTAATYRKINCVINQQQADEPYLLNISLIHKFINSSRIASQLNQSTFLQYGNFSRPILS